MNIFFVFILLLFLILVLYLKVICVISELPRSDFSAFVYASIVTNNINNISLDNFSVCVSRKATHSWISFTSHSRSLVVNNSRYYPLFSFSHLLGDHSL